MSDNRPCVHCGAAWFGEAFPDPDHSPECPMVTGLYPVTADDIGCICAGCGAPFKIDGAKVERVVSKHRDFTVVVLVCVGCAVTERPVSV